MRLIVISSPIDLPDEAEIINQLFLSGLKAFNLRKPGISRTSLKHLIRQINPEFYNRISLHQYHELAPEFGIRKLHYTAAARADSKIDDWMQQLDHGYELSTGVHQVEMLAVLTCFKSLFYSPVFNSLSKPGYAGRVSAGFFLDKTAIIAKVIALGGICNENILLTRMMNFDGAAVLGTIWNSPQTAVKTLQLLQMKLNKLA